MNQLLGRNLKAEVEDLAYRVHRESEKALHQQNGRARFELTGGHRYPAYVPGGCRADEIEWQKFGHLSGPELQRVRDPGIITRHPPA